METLAVIGILIVLWEIFKEKFYTGTIHNPKANEIRRINQKIRGNFKNK